MPKVTWGEIIVDSDDPSWVMFIYKIQVRLDALMRMMISKMRMMTMMMMMRKMLQMMMTVIMRKMRRRSLVCSVALNNDDHCFFPQDSWQMKRENFGCCQKSAVLTFQIFRFRFRFPLKSFTIIARTATSKRSINHHVGKLSDAITNSSDYAECRLFSDS